MGGTIRVSSTVGSGSTFSFTAPFAPAADGGDIDALKEDDGAPGEPALARPLTILLVDDSEDNRLLIQSFLKTMPFKIDTAQNGRVAVEMFMESRYDIVLMDIQMPLMDGHEATRQMRQWERSRGQAATPVLALTAYALEEEIRKSYEAGCSGHLTKPVSKSALLEAIGTHTRDVPRHSGTQAPRAQNTAGAAENETTAVKVDKDLEDLIPGYLEKRLVDVSSIRDAAGSGNFEAIRVLGHTMKGSGGGYGFDRITEIGRQIEDAAKQGDKDECLRRADELASYLTHLTITYE
jgi:CheY-like chemotaxis protein